MADGRTAISDDDALRSSIAKTLQEIDELKVVVALEKLNRARGSKPQKLQRFRRRGSKPRKRKE